MVLLISVVMLFTKTFNFGLTFFNYSLLLSSLIFVPMLLYSDDAIAIFTILLVFIVKG